LPAGFGEIVKQKTTIINVIVTILTYVLNKRHDKTKGSLNLYRLFALGLIKAQNVGNSNIKSMANNSPSLTKIIM
jgi:hypothetical protein